jgi:hypothetical protein
MFTIHAYFTKFLGVWQWGFTPHIAHMPCHLFYAKRHTRVVQIPASCHAVWYDTVTYQIYCRVEQTETHIVKYQYVYMFGIEATDLGSICVRTTIKTNWSIQFAFYSPLLLQKGMWLELFQPECNTQQYVYWCNNPIKFILTVAFY